MTDTYYLTYDENQRIPKEEEPKAHIGYYQWVPLILSFQAILFYLPRPIWMILSTKSGVSVFEVTDAARECQHKSDTKSRDCIMTYMSNHMGQFLLKQMTSHAITNHCKRFWWRFYGKNLTITYLFMKIVYLINVLGQLYILDQFLGMNYHLYGFEVFSRLTSGKDWRTSDRFPRVTFCDFKIRVVGHIQRYTVQCSLPMNLLNEIIFIFIWFWLALVCVATIFSLIKWTYISVYVPGQIDYMHQRLVAMYKFKSTNDDSIDANIKKRDIWEFVRKFLRRDGCLLIRFVSFNASDTIAAELICNLWEYYLSHKNSINSLFERGERCASHREVNPHEDRLLEHELGNVGTKCNTLSSIDSGQFPVERDKDKLDEPTPAAAANNPKILMTEASERKTTSSESVELKPNNALKFSAVLLPASRAVADKCKKQIRRERNSSKRHAYRHSS